MSTKRFRSLVLTGSVWRATLLLDPGASDCVIELTRKGANDSAVVFIHERNETSELSVIIDWLSGLRRAVYNMQEDRKAALEAVAKEERKLLTGQPPRSMLYSSCRGGEHHTVGI